VCGCGGRYMFGSGTDLVNDIKRLLITLPRTNPSIIQGRGPGTMTFWLKLKRKKKKKEEELALSH